MNKKQEAVVETMTWYATNYQKQTGKVVETITLNRQQFDTIKPELDHDGHGNYFWMGKKVRKYG